MRKTPYLILLAAMLLCPAASAQMLPGDLLFFSDSDGMGSAIKASTGNYTHVALVESVGDTVWIIDATPNNGVARRPLSYLAGFSPEVYRLTVPFDTAAVVARAKSLVGRPYDDTFLPDNDAYYCSELIQAAFGDLFPSQPMNWRDANGKLPKYWKRHFKKLKMPVPEGVPGTNPTDMSRSPLLERVQ